jgi:hypothetical protein
MVLLIDFVRIYYCGKKESLSAEDKLYYHEEDLILNLSLRRYVYLMLIFRFIFKHIHLTLFLYLVNIFKSISFIFCYSSF